MAALDFPASPTLGQIYTANGKSWQWNGTAWDAYPRLTTGTASQLLANDGTGSFANVTVGTGLTYSSGILASTGSGITGPTGPTGPQGATGLIGATGPAGGGGNTVSVSTITALRAVNKLTYQFAYVEGYYVAGDGGGGNYYFDSSDTSSADNGGTIIVATDGGRWKLSYQERVSVKQFGAYSNLSNTATTTTAFQNAINWVSAQNNRTSIFVPSGEYSLNTLTVNNQPNVSIQGCGQSSRLILWNSTTADGIRVDGASTLFQLTDLWLIGSSSATAGAVVRLNSTVNPSAFLTNVLINNGYYGLVVNCGIPDINAVNLVNVFVTAAVHTNILDYSGFALTGGIINGGGSTINGIWKIAGTGPYISNTDIFACKTGVRLQPTSGNTVAYSRFVNTTVTNGDYGFVLDGTVGNVLDVCIAGGIGALCTVNGLLITGQYVNGVNVTGFQARACTNGMYLNACSNVSICQSISTGNSANGVYVAANTVRFTMSNNFFGNVAGGGNNGQYGVYVASGTSNVYIITLNQFAGNTSGSLFDGGSGTTKIISNNL